MRPADIRRTRARRLGVRRPFSRSFLAPTSRAAPWFVALLSGLAWLVPLSGRAEAPREACVDAHEQAQLLRLRGDLTGARAQLLRCAQSGCPAPLVNECVPWLAELEKSLPSVVFAVVNQDGQDLVDVRVTSEGRVLAEQLDGRAISLNPGSYEFMFEAPGYQTSHYTAVIREAEQHRIIRAQLNARATPEHEDKGASSRLGYAPAHVLAGGALLSLGTGLILGAIGKRSLDRLEDACMAGECSESERTRGRRLYVGADVAFAVSAGLALAATFLYVRTKKRGARELAQRWTPKDRGMSLRVSF